MSKKSLTVSDIMKIAKYLEEIKITKNEAEQAEINELIEKLGEMEARS